MTNLIVVGVVVLTSPPLPDGNQSQKDYCVKIMDTFCQIGEIFLLVEFY